MCVFVCVCVCVCSQSDEERKPALTQADGAGCVRHPSVMWTGAQSAGCARRHGIAPAAGTGVCTTGTQEPFQNASQVFTHKH